MAEHVPQLLAASDVEKVVEQVLCSRRLRSPLFASDLFKDPAWDIMLHLFRAHLRHEKMSLGTLSDAIELSFPTTRRWVDALSGDGLLQPLGDSETDRMKVELSSKGTSAMRRWVGQWLNCSCDAVSDDRVTSLLSRMTGSNLAERR